MLIESKIIFVPSRRDTFRKNTIAFWLIRVLFIWLTDDLWNECTKLDMFKLWQFFVGWSRAWTFRTRKHQHLIFLLIFRYGTGYVEYQNSVNDSIGDPNYYLDIGVHSFRDPSWPAVVNWVVLVPWGFRRLLNYVWNQYGNKEIVITENGWADVESILNDTERITYISVRI